MANNNLSSIQNIILRKPELWEIWIKKSERIAGYFELFLKQRLSNSGFSVGFRQFLHKSLQIFLDYPDSLSKICTNFC